MNVGVQRQDKIEIMHSVCTFCCCIALHGDKPQSGKLQENPFTARGSLFVTSYL